MQLKFLVFYLKTLSKIARQIVRKHGAKVLIRDLSGWDWTAQCYCGLLDSQGFCVKLHEQPDRTCPKLIGSNTFCLIKTLKWLLRQDWDGEYRSVPIISRRDFSLNTSDKLLTQLLYVNQYPSFLITCRFICRKCLKPFIVGCSFVTLFCCLLQSF